MQFASLCPWLVSDRVRLHRRPAANALCASGYAFAASGRTCTAVAPPSDSWTSACAPLCFPPVAVAGPAATSFRWRRPALGGIVQKSFLILRRILVRFSCGGGGEGLFVRQLDCWETVVGSRFSRVLYNRVPGRGGGCPPWAGRDRFPTLGGPGGRSPACSGVRGPGSPSWAPDGTGPRGERAEDFSVWRAMIGGVIARRAPRLGEVLGEFVPVVEDLGASGQVIVDGALSSCWGWSERSVPLSGGHGRAGVGLQVVADLTSRLLRVSGQACSMVCVSPFGRADADDHDR